MSHLPAELTALPRPSHFVSRCKENPARLQGLRSGDRGSGVNALLFSGREGTSERMGFFSVFVAHFARSLSRARSDSFARMQQRNFSVVQGLKTQILCGVTANFLLFVRVKMREVSQVVMYPMTAALLLAAIGRSKSFSALHCREGG